MRSLNSRVCTLVVIKQQELLESQVLRSWFCWLQLLLIEYQYKLSIGGRILKSDLWALPFSADTSTGLLIPPASIRGPRPPQAIPKVSPPDYVDKGVWQESISTRL